MSSGAGFLLVRSGARRIGLPVAQLVEVAEAGPVYAVPSLDAAVRGVTTARGRIMPLVHLGALLDGRDCPTERGTTVVVATLGGREICLEVDEAEMVLHEAGVPMPAGQGLPFAAGVTRDGHGLITLLDLGALGARFTEAAR